VFWITTRRPIHSCKARPRSELMRLSVFVAGYDRTVPTSVFHFRSCDGGSQSQILSLQIRKGAAFKTQWIHIPTTNVQTPRTTHSSAALNINDIHQSSRSHFGLSLATVSSLVYRRGKIHNNPFVFWCSSDFVLPSRYRLDFVQVNAVDTKRHKE
jgi:hypothetical protein